MKKIKIILLLMILPLVFCSCSDREYGLIEITCSELVKNINSDKDFVFAIVNETQEDTEEFVKALNDVASSAKIKIYYVDYLHLDSEAAGTLLFESFSSDFMTNGYHVLKDGSLIESMGYTSFKDMYKILKDKIYDDELELLDENTKLSYLGTARKLYAEEKYTEAHDYLCKAWSLKEAKEEHKNNKYYNLVNLWEHFVITTDEPEMITYRNIYFYSNDNMLYRTNVVSKFEGFKKPTGLTGYDELYYKIENDIIYTKVSENSKYKETYKINDISDTYLKLTDLETNKEYTYNLRR